jgi:polysaccharide export outer membrane protein
MHNLKISNRHGMFRLTFGCLVAALATFALQPMSTAQTTNPPNNLLSGPQGVKNEPTLSTRNGPSAIPNDFANLKLAPGFLLNVDVYGESELSGRVRVDNDGNITFPFIGTLHVAGDSVPDAQNKIQKRFLEAQILTNPQVTINVEQFAATNVTVLGEVQTPGRIELLVPHTLLDVLGMAGGVTPLAGRVIEVKHTDASAGPINNVYQYSRGSNGDTIRDVMVRPGDTIIVKRAGIVYVLGAVNRPGGYVMQEDGELNVAQAISLAQGLIMQAKTSSVRVVKHGDDGQLIEVPVSYKGMMDGKEAPLKLQAEDIVYVPVNKLKAIFSTSSSLIGQTAAAAIYVH